VESSRKGNYKAPCRWVGISTLTMVIDGCLDSSVIGTRMYPIVQSERVSYPKALDGEIAPLMIWGPHHMILVTLYLCNITYTVTLQIYVPLNPKKYMRSISGSGVTSTDLRY